MMYILSDPQNPKFRKTRFKGGGGRKPNIGGGGLGYRERPGLGMESPVSATLRLGHTVQFLSCILAWGWGWLEGVSFQVQVQQT